MTATPSDQEIDAYIDGQLDTEGRFAVEDYLRLHPDMAARVMGDLGRRSALQLLARDRDPLPSRLVDQAGPGPSSGRPRWRRWAPAAGLSASGIAAALLVMLQGPPAYVEDALASHMVAGMRAGMDSQIEAPKFDAREIQLATNIAVPKVPADWKVTDVQVFPTDRGPALVMALKTRDGDQLSLFAKRERNGAPQDPDAVREGSHSVAYWGRGDMSYALVGDSEPSAIDARAEALARSWS
ncbi:MAG TPA: anti-sigma factor [Sphingopyxis sp.]|uniref:anti-sigma factor family protein n=1 Tax=Sphingopyxis sp. TaxID=1908224 RepID=UPI002B670AEF|nr:anti-sigma factor [Sphingopyxis sp.]HWW57772.1 anti-sigma factor [Sphingopyxis sp.]